MRKQQRIQERQNEVSMLRHQCAARFFYNRAEQVCNWMFLVSLISAFSALIPSFDGSPWSGFLLVLPISCDLLATVFYYVIHSSVKNAALLRNYFDSYVLGFDLSPYSVEQIRSINSLTSSILNKKAAVASVQLRNTGRDNPPGVKNWYEFAKDFSDVEVVHECQRQNIWWKKEQFKCRLVISFFSLAIIVTIISLLFLHGVSVYRLFLCAVCLVVTFIERILNYIKYIRLSIKIDGVSEAIDLCSNQEQIEFLQQYISETRKIPVLGVNAFHKSTSRRMSEQYAVRIND